MTFKDDLRELTALLTICVVMFVLGHTAGCGILKPTCLVIDAAHAACAVITVPTADGGTETVTLSRDELVATARTVKAAHRAADAGAP